ncbi:PLDc_N domain-containing protein [Rossellomorea vietnamensis]|uniref:PLDc_N domain-containing protein n=1 Tax=Rossellomorea vietnamensis TaxID=218284 RepID=A0A5D4MJM8_9BACI|nr:MULTISPECIES: PLD nuclease N-terminal domain-containing protein [Bacillaceae]TYS01589.1 PLDc_N domain-containing protein [Rossellomorea vietnamensis]
MAELQEVIDSINWGLVAPLLIIQLILMVTALVDLIRIKNTNGPKWLWVLIILFINIIGPIIYFVIGRRQNG